MAPSICVCVCVFDYMCVLMSTFANVHDFGHLYADVQSLVENGFLGPLSKKCHRATIKTRLAHICTEKSHKCGMSSIQNSFHTGVNSLFSSQRFVLAPSLYFRLNFMCPNVC